METVGHNKIAINFVWTLLAGFLVMFMQAGFAMVETGFCRAKNAAHTMSMNFMVYPLGMFGYWVCGFALQMGGVGAVASLGGGTPPLNHEFTINLFGTAWACSALKGFFLSGDTYDVGVFTLFLFQMVFMDTTVTIPTGAMAERWKWSSFCRLRASSWATFVYPLFGNWVWGGGWLAHARLELRPRPRPRRLRRIVGRAHGRRRGGAGRRDRPRAAHRQVHQGRRADRDSRPRHPDGDRRHVHPGVRLVRLQPRLDAGRRRPAHRRRRHQHHAGRHGRRAVARCSSSG